MVRMHSYAVFSSSGDVSNTRQQRVPRHKPFRFATAGYVRISPYNCMNGNAKRWWRNGCLYQKCFEDT